MITFTEPSSQSNICLFSKEISSLIVSVCIFIWTQSYFIFPDFFKICNSVYSLYYYFFSVVISLSGCASGAALVVGFPSHFPCFFGRMWRDFMFPALPETLKHTKMSMEKSEIQEEEHLLFIFLVLVCKWEWIKTCFTSLFSWKGEGDHSGFLLVSLNLLSICVSLPT